MHRLERLDGPHPGRHLLARLLGHCRRAGALDRAPASMIDALRRLLGAPPAPPPPPDLAQVGVYQRGDQLLVAVDDQTEAGFWVATDRITRLPATAAPDALGAAIHAALAASRTGVPTPTFRGAPPLDAPLWRAAGVRSRRAFMTGTRLCVVSRAGAALTLAATMNGGTSGDERGWGPLAAALRTLPATSDAPVLGAAVQAALQEARPWPPTPDAV